MHLSRELPRPGQCERPEHLPKRLLRQLDKAPDQDDAYVFASWQDGSSPLGPEPSRCHLKEQPAPGKLSPRAGLYRGNTAALVSHYPNESLLVSHTSAFWSYSGVYVHRGGTGKAYAGIQGIDTNAVTCM